MNPLRQHQLLLTRRQLLGRTATGIGTAALGSLLNRRLLAESDPAALKTHGALPSLHFPAKAKRVIYLHMSGGPSQLDLWDYKPELEKHRAADLKKMPEIQMGQRITGMTTSGQATLPIAPSIFKFAQQGKCGTWVSELLPHTGQDRG